MKKYFFSLITFYIIQVNSFGQQKNDCSCTPLTYNVLVKLGNLDDSEREDFFLENCYQPSRVGKIESGLTFKSFTKCNLKKMIDQESNEFYQGDYTVKIWSDNSIQFTTKKLAVYQTIKKQVNSKALSKRRESNIDFYTVENMSVTFQSATDRDGNAIYMATFQY
jgi:hypothetical protein